MYWFIIGAILIASEMLFPVFILLFIGIGAMIAGVAMLYDVSLTYSIVIFITTSLILLIIFPSFLRKTYKKPTQVIQGLHIGKNAVVTSPIDKNQMGMIELEGSFWNATSEHDLISGQLVIITKHDQNNDILLHVKPINGVNS